MFVFLFYIELCERELGESKEYRRFLTTEGQEKGLHYNLWVIKHKKKKKKKKRISRKKKTQQESDSAWMINKNIPSLSLLFYLVNLRNVEGWRLFILEKKTKNAFYFCF
jgi:hypothetical protein